MCVCVLAYELGRTLIKLRRKKVNDIRKLQREKNRMKATCKSWREGEREGGGKRGEAVSTV